MLKPLFCLFFISCALFASAPDVYRKIPDLLHPRKKDWEQLQEFLSHGKREELHFLEEAVDPGAPLYDYKHRARRFRLIGKHSGQTPQFGIEPIRCSMEDKECCVITYASYNKRYPEGISLLRAQLEKVGFRGHFLYRIGGWPDLESGSLVLAHVPYAFKPCLFQEARRLGYKKVLWVDTSIRPLLSLEETFQTIEKKGYFFYRSGHTLTPFCPRQAIEWFGLSIDEARTVQSLTAAIIGLNLEHPQGIQALDQWMDAARAEVGFLSPRPDQNSLSMIAYRLGMQDFANYKALSWDQTTLCEESLFFFDYGSVK